MPTRLTEMERAVWQDTVSSFPSWYFTTADKMLLVAYCRAVVRLEKSEKALQKTAAVEKKANGSPCLNPHISIINMALAQIVQLSEKLCITKATRRGIPPPSPGNEPSPGGGVPGDPDGDGPEFPTGLIAPPLNAPNG
jgi:phage terminase small subunit